MLRRVQRCRDVGGKESKAGGLLDSRQWRVGTRRGEEALQPSRGRVEMSSVEVLR
jgi:hypothetical protein